MPKKVDPESLIEGFSQKLQAQWTQHRRQAFNNNTKGAAYEKALQEFLIEYFDGLYRINTRTAVIDGNLRCFDVFNSGEMEIDLVATFRQSVPGIVFKSGDMQWVPYKGVAFICEVKSNLTKTALEHDLDKLSKLCAIEKKRKVFSNVGTINSQTAATKLTLSDSGKTLVKNASVDHQLKCLVYDESSISGESLMNLATENQDNWDIILIVDENAILISPNLPFVEAWYDRISIGDQPIDKELFPDVLALSDGLIWFILLLTISIPRPIPFDVSEPLIQLVQGEWNEDSKRYNDRIGDWHLLF